MMWKHLSNLFFFDYDNIKLCYHAVFLSILNLYWVGQFPDMIPPKNTYIQSDIQQVQVAMMYYYLFWYNCVP